MTTHPTDTVTWDRDGAPALLNDDGTASIATLLMAAHHGLRRDLTRLASALRRLPEDLSRAGALNEAWQRLQQILHHHHHTEDEAVFPGLRAAHAELEPVIDRLTADHRRMDPLLDRVDGAFAELPELPETAGAAAAVLGELNALLDAHLALEESRIVPHLRGSRHFPAPASDAEVELRAQGFAWSLDGLAPEVQEQILAMLPGALVARLPAARAAFEVDCDRVWGPGRPTGASRTPVPDWTGRRA